ncbi:MAG TPA: protein translocase subunit SecD [Candidatus Limnocylindrales bacterium]|nr:protein translocase subunit SecD [Candidatus Limnocylindrales bacterium]
MRRLIPFIIVAVGLAALAVDFAPNLPRPFSDPPASFDTKLGLDIEGGLSAEYEAVAPSGQTVTAGDMATIRTIIENRVNATGLAEPTVSTVGNDRLSVEIPGVKDVDAVRKLIGSTGQLEFVPLDPSADKYGSRTSPGALAVPTQGQPLDLTANPPLFSGDQIDAGRVAPGFDSTTGQRVVQFGLKGEGAQKFAQYTSSHVGDYFAIVLDGVVQSAPYIQSAITSGTGQISGSFTTQELNDLVTTLKYGALPLALKEVQFSPVSATLGQDFLRQSLVGGAIGILLVFLFMLVYYRLQGGVAVFALVYYTLVNYAIFRALPVTLTLAGLAGFVLSVGMAVDANILIFERTKEELRAGKPLASAVEAGFNRAWPSILDSNVSSLITASILYILGTSTIRGFALVLIIGVLTSMFTAITLSRVILRFLVRQPWSHKARLFGVADDQFVVYGPRVRGRRADVRV